MRPSTERMKSGTPNEKRAVTRIWPLVSFVVLGNSELDCTLLSSWKDLSRITTSLDPPASLRFARNCTKRVD